MVGSGSARVVRDHRRIARNAMTSGTGQNRSHAIWPRALAAAHARTPASGPPPRRTRGLRASCRGCRTAPGRPASRAGSGTAPSTRRTARCRRPALSTQSRPHKATVATRAQGAPRPIRRAASVARRRSRAWDSCAVVSVPHGAEAGGSTEGDNPVNSRPPARRQTTWPAERYQRRATAGEPPRARRDGLKGCGYADVPSPADRRDQPEPAQL
jgi:hypothetical protein